MSAFPSTPAPGSPIHLLMSCDDGFARPLMVALHSLKTHLGAKRQATIHFLDFGLSTDNETKVRRIADDPRITLDWRKQTDVSWMPSEAIKAGTTPAQCARMLAASIFPELDRILFLDADIVVQADIGELWDTPFSTPIAAVRDQFFPWVGLCTWMDLKGLGIDPKEPHFNGGIWVADLARWRRDGRERELMDFYCRHHARLKTHDQDALNAVFKGQWQEISLAWNRGPWLDNAFHPEDVGATRKDFEEARRNPKIIHYPTPDKPWISGISSSLNDPFFDVAARIGMDGWGVPRRPLMRREHAWGLVMGLTHRFHLHHLGILPIGRFLAGNLTHFLRHPVLFLTGITLFITRKTK